MLGYAGPMYEPDAAQFEPVLTPRRADRVDRSFEARVCREGQPDVSVRIENLSAHGFRMTAVPDLPERAFFYLQVTDEIRHPAQARWLGEGQVGCEFPRHLTSRQYLQILHATGTAQAEPPSPGLLGRLRKRLLG